MITETDTSLLNRIPTVITTWARATFAIAITAAIMLTGFSSPAQAASRTTTDKNCRTIVAGSVCVEMSKYVSGSTSRYQWRVIVAPVKGRWIQPLKYTTFGINKGGDWPPVCTGGSCPKFTSKKIGKWRNSPDEIVRMTYRSASGSNDLMAGRASVQDRNCKTIVAGKVCFTVITKLHRHSKSTSSVLQVYPKAGRTITPISQRVYNGDGSLKASKSYCSKGCKPQSKTWGGTLATKGWVGRAYASYTSASGISGIASRGAA